MSFLYQVKIQRIFYEILFEVEKVLVYKIKIWEK